MRKIVTLAVALAVTGTVLAGCSSTSSADSSAVLRIGTTTSCDSTNPFVAVSTTCTTLFRYNYPYLTEYTDKGTVKGDFAKKWTTSSDGLTWTFDLYSGAKWSDGKPLTAKDAAFTINTVIKYADSAAAVQSNGITNIKTAVAKSNDQLVVTYTTPTANVPGRLASLPVLPQHVWASSATGDGAKLKQLKNTAPIVAGGPFQLVKYSKDEIAQMKANPNFYGKKPTLSGFGLQFFSSPDAMVNALKNKQIDYASPLPVTAASSIKGTDTTIVERPGYQFHELIMNQSPNQTAHPELRDLKVREAFEMAVDRKTIIKTAYLGHATVGASIIPPADSEWYNPDVKPLDFDPTKAAALLDEAGYKLGSDGVRVADGKPMSYDVILPSDQGGEGERALQIIADDFKQIGVVIKAKPADPASAFSQISGTDNKYESFTLAYWSWIPRVDPDFILNAMRCSQWGSWSDSAFCNKQFDSLYDQQAKETDDSARKAIVDKMQQIVYDEKPYIVVNYDNIVEAHSNSWTGFGDSPRGVLDTQTREDLMSVIKK